jgi:hypothetical protein
MSRAFAPGFIEASPQQFWPVRFKTVPLSKMLRSHERERVDGADHSLTLAAMRPANA